MLIDIVPTEITWTFKLRQVGWLETLCNAGDTLQSSCTMRQHAEMSLGDTPRR